MRKSQQSLQASQASLVPRPVGLYGLDAYRVALEFYEGVMALVASASNIRPAVRDQLLRAAEQTVLNIGEAHPAIGADRARRFRNAASEASECGVALDLVARGGVSPEALAPLSALLDRVRAMLWRLSRPR